MSMKILPSSAELCISESPQRNCIFRGAPAETLLVHAKVQMVFEEISAKFCVFIEISAKRCHFTGPR